MFRFCFNSTTLRNMDVLEAIREIKDCGYEGVELTLNDSHLHPLTTSLERIREIKKYAGDAGIDIACVAAGGANLLGEVPYEPSLISVEKAGRDKRIEVIKKSIEIANYLGAPVLNINSGKLAGAVGADRAEEYLLSGIESLLRELGGLILVFEPEPDFFIGTSQAGIDLIDRINSPQLRLNLDIGHVFCSETDCYTAVEKALPYSGHIHIEDIKGGIHHHEIPGEGDIDFVRIMSLIKASGYDKHVSVELHHHDMIWRRALEESLAYLSKLR
ncbi:MAG: sugar phosphate isomerase/epimerase [Clostridiales bacterium]|nr:sugar phosphate isomerase/epimerase [Clostridiales bacterium]